MSVSNHPELLLGALERAWNQYQEGQRLKVTGEVASKLVKDATSLLTEIARSPQVGMALSAVGQIGANRMQDELEEAQLDVCKTVEPVQHLRSSYAAFDQAVASLHDFTSDTRFWWAPNPFRRPLEERVPLNEVVERVMSLQGLLFGAALDANRATVEILRSRDPRAALGARPAELPSASLETLAYLVPLPNKPYSSELEAVKRIRILLLLMANQLHQAADRGRKLLRRGKVDTAERMVQPAVVIAALTDLNYTLLCGLLTCAALSRLANESRAV